MAPPALNFLCWIPAAAGLGFFLYASLAPAAIEARPSDGRRWPALGPGTYAAALGVVLLLFRWPVIFNPRNVGIDEGLWIGGALTLWKDPVFWRAVDGDSAGPLVFYALMPLEPLGLLNYAGIKIAATALLGGALWFSYAALRAWWGDALARLGVLPAVCFWAGETRLEFVSYSTEHVTLLLLAIGLSGVFCSMARPDSFTPRSLAWLGAGVALGAVPFAKLQGVPSAAFLLLVAAGWAATRRAWDRRRRIGAIARLAGAVCVVPLGFALTLAAGLKAEDFWTPYIELNAARSTHAFGADANVRLLAWDFVDHSGMLQGLLLGALVVAMLAAIVGRSALSRRAWPLLVLAGLLGVAMLTAFVPAYSFHHFHLLVLPLTLLAGGVVATCGETQRTDPGAVDWPRRGLMALWLAVLVALPLALLVHQGNALWSGAATASMRTEIGPMAREILQRARPGDALTVWGSQHGLHAQTRLIQGTREANPRIPVVGPRFRDYFRRRYLADLERSGSRFFVDQTSASPEDAAIRARWAHEADPAVRDYVARHYDYAGEFEGMRLFVRKAPDV